MKRSKFSLSHYRLASFHLGKLIPVCVYEVLPGDSIQQATSALVRVSPLAAPLMHPCVVRIHHWYVPNRLVWHEWESFITGGKDGQGDGYSYPTLSSNWSTGSIPDYMGVKTGVNDTRISALPLRCYNLIYNEFYRDQDLINEVTADNTVILRHGWEKDYFTSARPWPQKGPEVTLPIGSVAPVKGLGVGSSVYTSTPVSVKETPGEDSNWTNGYKYVDPASGNTALYVRQDGQHPGYPGIYADLTNATGMSVMELREMFAIQRYQEARARYGSRYTEYLRYLGVRPSDARLQRPEYLGGGKATISFSEILQTAPNVTAGTSGTTGVGDLKGHGIAALRSRRYRRFFEEHGHVVTLMSIRPKSMYSDGLNKMWNRRVKEDYWQQELQHVGMQAILNKEVYVQGTAADDSVFGFNDRYAEYRHIQSGISGQFRTLLNDWHFARQFSALPVLNQSFVECDPTTRVFQDQTNDTIWCMVNNNIQARRLVSKTASGHIY